MIDTHIHNWNLEKASYKWLEGDHSILNRSWALDEIEKERKQIGVTAGVLVQAAPNLEDTRWMLETADETDWIKGVVCWLPLADTALTQKLLEESFIKEPYCSGIRHQIHDEPDPEWLLQPSVINSLRLLAKYQLPFDVVAVKPEHIETALTVAGKVPGLKMVFDHLAQPPIKTGERFGKWGEWMKTAATHKNFHAKISGLGTASGNFQNRTTSDILPYVEFVLEHFGTGRCFCGTDWPVSQLAATYTDTWNQTVSIINTLVADETEKEKITTGNANQFYNLQITV
jgi:L-fuconolactonase